MLEMDVFDRFVFNFRNNKVIAGDNEQSSVPNIYAIGDILNDKLELTPIAIQAGKLLSRRLYNNESTLVSTVPLLSLRLFRSLTLLLSFAPSSLHFHLLLFLRLFFSSPFITSIHHPFFASLHYYISPPPSFIHP